MATPAARLKKDEKAPPRAPKNEREIGDDADEEDDPRAPPPVPFAPLIRAEIWEVLAKLKAEGQAILLIDKNLAAVTRLADRHVVIEKGRTVWTGDSAALAAAPEVRDSYLHL